MAPLPGHPPFHLLKMNDLTCTIQIALFRYSLCSTTCNTHKEFFPFLKFQNSCIFGLWCDKVVASDTRSSNLVILKIIRLLAGLKSNK